MKESIIRPKAGQAKEHSTLVPQRQRNSLAKIKISVTIKKNFLTIGRKINYNVHKLQHKLLKV